MELWTLKKTLQGAQAKVRVQTKGSLLEKALNRSVALDMEYSFLLRIVECPYSQEEGVGGVGMRGKKKNKLGG